MCEKLTYPLIIIYIGYMSSGSLAFFGLFLFWTFLAFLAFFLLTNDPAEGGPGFQGRDARRGSYVHIVAGRLSLERNPTTSLSIQLYTPA